MYKPSQKDLLNEAFWDNFKNSKIGRAISTGYQAAKEIGKVVAPKTSSQLTSMIQGVRDAKRRIGQAGKKMEDRILEWLDERGFTPLPEDPSIKKLKDYPDGNSQWRVKVGMKDVDPDTGNITVAKTFKFPVAIILHDKKDDSFKFLVYPADQRRGAKGV